MQKKNKNSILFTETEKMEISGRLMKHMNDFLKKEAVYRYLDNAPENTDVLMTKAAFSVLETINATEQNMREMALIP